MSRNQKIIIAMKASYNSTDTSYPGPPGTVNFYINNYKNVFFAKGAGCSYNAPKRVYIGSMSDNPFPDIHIYYLCCCDAYHTNEQIDKNIQKLATIFEVDLEEAS